MLAALSTADIRFIIVGGLAVGAHGHPRATKHIDLVPDPSPDNLRRLAELLAELDYVIAGADEFEPDELVLPNFEGLAAGGRWVLQTKLGRLDVLQRLEPVITYDALDAEAIEDEVFGVRVRFCGYHHLVEMKRAAGRDQDRLDLAKLEAIRDET